MSWRFTTATAQVNPAGPNKQPGNNPANAKPSPPEAAAFPGGPRLHNRPPSPKTRPIPRQDADSGGFQPFAQPGHHPGHFPSPKSRNRPFSWLDRLQLKRVKPWPQIRVGNTSQKNGAGPARNFGPRQSTAGLPQLRATAGPAATAEPNRRHSAGAAPTPSRHGKAKEKSRAAIILNPQSHPNRRPPPDPATPTTPQTRPAAATAQPPTAMNPTPAIRTTNARRLKTSRPPKRTAPGLKAGLSAVKIYLTLIATAGPATTLLRFLSGCPD